MNLSDGIFPDEGKKFSVYSNIRRLVKKMQYYVIRVFIERLILLTEKDESSLLGSIGVARAPNIYH